MGRTPGAKNRTARELEAEARRLQEKAAHMRRTEALKKELAKARAKRRGAK